MHSISNALERLRTQLAQALPATPGLRHVDVSFPLNDAFDPLAWLGAQCLFPQFYWQQRNGDEELAALGAVIHFSSLAQASQFLQQQPVANDTRICGLNAFTPEQGSLFLPRLLWRRSAGTATLRLQLWSDRSLQEDADAALAAFQALAADNFGESPAAKPAAAPATPERVEGAALRYPLALIQPLRPAAADAAREQQRLRQAIDQTLADLIALTELAENKFNADIAAIFAGHHTLLDDDDLFDAANDRLLTEQCTAEWAWHQVLMELSQQYRQLDDPYLQARYIDIEDILQRTLRHLQGVQERVPTPGEPTIIIADNIYPSTVLQLDASFVKGLCLRDGSEQAHGAIIARAAGIAWLSQQGEALNSVQPGETIVLDMRHQRLIRD